MIGHSNRREVNRSTDISRRSVLQTIGGLGATGLAGVGSAQSYGMRQRQTQSPNIGSDPAILVFSATAGYRHQSIPTANATIKELATEIGNENDVGITVDIIESDASVFPSNADDLAQYDVVIWNSTTGDVLNSEQQAAFEQYIKNGGAYAGIHAADIEYDWSWYGGFVGAYFESHPLQQTATVNVTDRTHPSTDHLPAVWERYDEWYNYRENPRGDVHVLATLDESSYDPNGSDNPDEPANDHPIAWAQHYEGARSWYIGMGHTTESYSNEDFRKHIKGGIMWEAGYVGEDEWIQLFNGENLDDWTPKFTGQSAGEGYKNTFTVEDRLLKVNYDQYNEWDGTIRIRLSSCTRSDIVANLL
jgi:cytochrome c